MANKFINNKNKIQIEEIKNFIKNINNEKVVLNNKSVMLSNETLKRYNEKLGDKEVLINIAAIAFFSRVLDAYFPTTNERETMSYIAKNNLKDFDTYTREAILNVRQLIYSEYRHIMGIPAGLEYDRLELVRECEPNISRPLIAACEVISKTNKVKYNGAELIFLNKEKEIANGIVNKKASIISLGEEYRSEMGKLGIQAERLIVNAEMNKK